MIPRSLTQIAANTENQNKIGNYLSTLNQDERQPRPFSVTNQWSNADHAPSAEYENVQSWSFLNLAPHTAVVTAVLPVGYASFFNQFYNANLASYFHALATMIPAVCNPLVFFLKNCLI